MREKTEKLKITDENLTGSIKIRKKKLKEIKVLV